MRILFTKCNTLISKTIRTVLDEPVSHIGLEFDNDFVIHSDFFGTRIEKVDHYISENIVVYSITIPLKNEIETLFEIMSKSLSNNYDFSAIAYFAWRLLLKKVFNTKFPEKNKLGDNHAYICTEMLQFISDEKLEKLQGKDLGMMTPYQIYLLLKEN
jgi:hypothetical protein